MGVGRRLSRTSAGVLIGAFALTGCSRGSSPSEITTPKIGRYEYKLVDTIPGQPSPGVVSPTGSHTTILDVKGRRQTSDATDVEIAQETRGIANSRFAYRLRFESDRILRIGESRDARPRLLLRIPTEKTTYPVQRYRVGADCSDVVADRSTVVGSETIRAARRTWHVWRIETQTVTTLASPPPNFPKTIKQKATMWFAPSLGLWVRIRHDFESFPGPRAGVSVATLTTYPR